MSTGVWVSRDGRWWVGVRRGWMDGRGRQLREFIQIRDRGEVIAEVHTVEELAGLVPLHELEETQERPAG